MNPHNADDFSYDVVLCAICGEPAPYRLWRGERLLACLCDIHHGEWWINHDLLLHELMEAAAALDEVIP